jgi:acetylornithine deacetylase
MDVADVEFLPPWIRMPALSPNDEAKRWLEPVRDAIGRALGRTPEVGGVPFGTDAGPLGESGRLPCFVFGPGDIAQAHTKDEWIELDQVREASEAYYRIAADLGCA